MPANPAPRWNKSLDEGEKLRKTYHLGGFYRMFPSFLRFLQSCDVCIKEQLDAVDSQRHHGKKLTVFRFVILHCLLG